MKSGILYICSVVYNLIIIDFKIVFLFNSKQAPYLGLSKEWELLQKHLFIHNAPYFIGNYNKSQVDTSWREICEGISLDRFRLILYKKNGNHMRKLACWLYISLLKDFLWLHEVTVQNIFKLLILKDSDYSQNSPTIFFVLDFLFFDPYTFPIPTTSLILGFYPPIAGKNFKDFSYLIC